MSLFKHQARKRFGQNFLVHSGIIRQIIQSIYIQPKDEIIEIGPGRGALTAEIIQRTSELTVIELDRDLIPFLKLMAEPYPSFRVVEADALTINFSELKRSCQKMRVVGNLPYNISTPILFHLFQFNNDIQDLHFMLQKEVVDRMSAAPGSKDYGRLSVMCQYYCRVEKMFDVPPEAFDPAPKVNSSIVRLTPYVELPYLAHDVKTLEEIVRTAFNARRKTVQNALKSMISLEQLKIAEISPMLRAEDLSVKDYVQLANLISNL